MKNTKELIQKIHSEINKSSGILKDIKVIHEKIKKKWRKQNKKEREREKNIDSFITQIQNYIKC